MVETRTDFGRQLTEAKKVTPEAASVIKVPPKEKKSGTSKRKLVKAMLGKFAEWMNEWKFIHQRSNIYKYA